MEFLFSCSKRYLSCLLCLFFKTKYYFAYIEENGHDITRYVQVHDITIQDICYVLGRKRFFRPLLFFSHLEVWIFDCRPESSLL